MHPANSWHFQIFRPSLINSDIFVAISVNKGRQESWPDRYAPRIGFRKNIFAAEKPYFGKILAFLGVIIINCNKFYALFSFLLNFYNSLTLARTCFQTPSFARLQFLCTENVALLGGGNRCEHCRSCCCCRCGSVAYGLYMSQTGRRANSSGRYS